MSARVLPLVRMLGSKEIHGCCLSPSFASGLFSGAIVFGAGIDSLGDDSHRRLFSNILPSVASVLYQALQTIIVYLLHVDNCQDLFLNH